MENPELQEIARRIAERPFEWILILGDMISHEESKKRKNGIIHIMKKEEEVLHRSCLYKEVAEKNYVGLADSLFGNVRKESGFLEEADRIRIGRRQEYALGFTHREQIDIGREKTELGKLLQIFPGIILSISPGEMVEAFLENQLSMGIEDAVWTPYSVMSSPKWNKWYRNRSMGLSEASGILPDNTGLKGRMLMKLYGTCRRPYQMLLSGQDMELFYPTEDNETCCTKFLLEELFRKKNLFIWGLDSIYCSGRQKTERLPFASGISKLLEATPEEGAGRYLYLENGIPAPDFEKYHIQRICLGNGAHEVVEELYGYIQKRNLVSKEKGISESVERIADNAGSGFPKTEAEETVDASVLQMGAKQIERLFWTLYSRRRESQVPDREKEILKIRILDSEGERKKWTRKSISLLAVAANRHADFYDLEKVLGWAEGNARTDPAKKDARFYELLLQKILCGQLNTISLELLQIWSFYGKSEKKGAGEPLHQKGEEDDIGAGFPGGFLPLLLDDDEDLESWKKAGIQLVNSGIYTQRHYRRYLQRRMEYADSVMKAAGKPQGKKCFANIVERVEHQLDDSYFYPFDKKCFSLDDIVPADPDGEMKMKVRFGRMFKNLLEILENRSEGYGHIYSLLETELATIIRRIQDVDDPRMEWKPALLYYLLRENSVKRSEIDKIDEQLELLLDKIRELEGQSGRETLYGKAMIRLTRGIIRSQFSTQEKQREALEECRKARETVEKAESDGCGTAGKVFVKVDEGQKKEGIVIISDKLFIQKVQIRFLECSIYGRLSTIAEVERCAKKQEVCDEQLDALEKMEKNLDEIRVFLNEREKATGYSYKELHAELECQQGELYFKMSQYKKESREFQKCNANPGSTEQETEVGPEDVEKGSEDSLRSEEQKNSVVFLTEEKCYRKAEKCYKKALKYYESYPYRYWMQCAFVKRSMANVHCWEGRGYEDKEKDKQWVHKIYREKRKKCYDLLADAYYLYRSHSDLHGIADVLQSMGNAEALSASEKADKLRMSHLCFYQAAESLYGLLGDQWSLYVVEAFKNGALEEVEADSTEG